MKDLPFSLSLKHRRLPAKYFTFRRCTAQDIDEIMSLQNLVSSRLEDEDLFVCNTREAYEEAMAEDFCFAAYTEGHLVYCSLMILNRQTPYHLGHYLHYTEEELLRSVSYDISFVHPAYRGFSLQRLGMNVKDEYARALGAVEALATVSPKNLHSLANARAHGFEILERRHMYRDVERFILRKKL